MYHLPLAVSVSSNLAMDLILSWEEALQLAYKTLVVLPRYQHCNSSQSEIYVLPTGPVQCPLLSFNHLKDCSLNRTTNITLILF